MFTDMNKKLKTADTLENRRRRLGQFFTPPPINREMFKSYTE